MRKYNDVGVINRPFISPFYTKFQQVPGTTPDGVLCTQGQFVEYSCAEDVKSSEFSIGNLVAIGAFGDLKYVSMSLNSDMNFVDEFAVSYNKLQSDVTQASQS